ncbi:MAG: hypothetical protein ABIJ05_04220 [Patescibacteria group bacterium]
MASIYDNLNVPVKKGGGVIKNININSLSLGEIISSIIPWIFYIAGFALLLMLVLGGFQLLTSAGDKNAMEAAKKRVTNSIVGFVIIFASYWIVQLVGKILGIGIFSQLFKF